MILEQMNLLKPTDVWFFLDVFKTVCSYCFEGTSTIFGLGGRIWGIVSWELNGHLKVFEASPRNCRNCINGNCNSSNSCCNNKCSCTHLGCRGISAVRSGIFERFSGKDGSWGTPQTSPNRLSSWWFGTWLLWLSNTFHILGMSSSQLTFIFFRGVGIPPTSYFALLICGVKWDPHSITGVLRHGAKIGGRVFAISEWSGHRTTSKNQNSPLNHHEITMKSPWNHYTSTLPSKSQEFLQSPWNLLRPMNANFPPDLGFASFQLVLSWCLKLGFLPMKMEVSRRKSWPTWL